jgi:hypothetical protein
MNTNERGRRSILKTMNKFTIKEKLIIIKHYETDEEINDTTIIDTPLWKYLTELKSSLYFLKEQYRPTETKEKIRAVKETLLK